ncbi:MAG TPA: methyltransferase domain-containing protein [Pyrinomonadaceae bacterium]|nr:methyltransferase domain-containing protein [Pyrinomonadaceae bacterium]
MDAQSQNSDNLNLADLMNQIRKDAETRKRYFNNGAASIFGQLNTQQLDALPPFDGPPLPLRLQPELEKHDQYDVNDLLGFHDEAFVRNAYEAILKREPDDAGLAHFLANLRSGRYSKLDILSSLRFSPEGRNANVFIEGLKRGSVLRKLYRVPVAGYLVRLAVAIVRLPVLITNFRRVETHTMAQLDRVASHVNEAVAYLENEIRVQTEPNRTQFEEMQEQINDLRATLRLQIDALIREHGKLAQSQNDLKSSSRFDKAIQLAQQQGDVQQRHAAELEALKVQLEKQIDGVMERLQKFRMDIAQQETRLSRLLDGANGSPAAPLMQPEKDHLLDSFYFSLEDVLRGTRDEIKEQVKVYLPVLQQAGIKANILDVGCGRGEWLQVLRDEGFEARGIDTNRILVQQCKEMSLDVIEAEALTYLRSLTDGSLNAVTGFHFAEHLPIETLVRFLDETGRVLKPGGLLILETPNPENLVVGSCNFYLDPTHNNPIPIPTMKLLLEARGFRCEEVLKLHAINTPKIEVNDLLTSHVNHYLYGPMNYAVVARKPGI